MPDMRDSKGMHLVITHLVERERNEKARLRQTAKLELEDIDLTPDVLGRISKGIRKKKEANY